MTTLLEANRSCGFDAGCASTFKPSSHYRLLGKGSLLIELHSHAVTDPISVSSNTLP
jgi:hypothetical protein